MDTRDMTPAPAPAPSSQGIDLWDSSEPRSLINIVPPAVANALVAASGTRTDLFGMDERTLYKHLRSDNKLPSPTDNRLRLSFWNEYDRAQASQKPMQMNFVYAGVCTREYFYSHYLKNADKVAWLACPPASYQVIAEEALSYGLEQMREILSLPLKDAAGRINVKLGELQAKIVTMLDTRVKGAVTQKHMNLQISTTDKQVAKMAMDGTMDDLDRRLRELELREKRALNLPVGSGELSGENAQGPGPDIEVEVSSRSYIE